MKKLFIALLLFTSSFAFADVPQNMVQTQEITSPSDTAKQLEFSSNVIIHYEGDSVSFVQYQENHIVIKEHTIEINGKIYADYMFMGFKKEISAAFLMVVPKTVNGVTPKPEEWILYAGEKGTEAIVVFKNNRAFTYWYDVKLDKAKRT